jgi:hypothetical protein
VEDDADRRAPLTGGRHLSVRGQGQRRFGAQAGRFLPPKWADAVGLAHLGRSDPFSPFFCSFLFFIFFLLFSS